MKIIDDFQKYIQITTQRLSPIKYKLLIYLLFIFCVAAALYGIQIEFESRYVADDAFQLFANTSIILNLTHPFSPGIYFSSFVHQVGDNHAHLYGNIQTYLIFAIMVFIIWILRTVWDIPLPDKYFRYTYLSIFLIAPFCISLFVMFGATYTFISPETCRGFSGITYAIVGVFIAQLFLLLQKLCHWNTWKEHAIFIILGILFGILYPFYDIVYVGQPGNFFGHMGGCIVGFLISYFMELRLTK